ncbi:MAG: DoxX family membrane protein [Deltaproteobacteria bacterium]|nr:DoxX family membrane protein [Deltaproteobacteria bacterium]
MTAERIMDWSGHRWLAFGARLYLAVIFGMAAAYKILHPGSFALDVATYGILPLSLINGFALVVPWVEAVVGVMLLAGFRVRAAALLVSGMMVMFMVALAVALAQGLDMSCGCFASAETGDADPIGWTTMVRDTAWLALAVYVLLADRRPLGLDGLWSARRKT